MKEIYIKKFSVGLNLNEDLEKLELFFKEFGTYLSSVYFSVPLGNKYYSRDMLAKEYSNESKFLQAVRLIEKYEIRTEVTVNTYGLKEEDLKKIHTYLISNNIIPDEIVCLVGYSRYFRKAFPMAEIKYSFNNSQLLRNTEDEILQFFDTVVVGKEYLRSEEKRHNFIKKNKKVVLLINSGCSFECRNGCGTTAYCNAILNKNLKEKDLNYLYALQSFFPEELHNLMRQDSYKDMYRFKISNRPLGLDYTRNALEAYINWDSENTLEAIEEDSKVFSYFCTMGVLLKKSKCLDIHKIMLYKFGC